MKRDNAENQRARIAPGLDRHGIVWSGCRGGWWGAAGRIGCQRAGGAFGGAERLVIDGGICVPAIRQSCGPWGEVRFGATESGEFGLLGLDRLPAGWWTIRTCRKVGHLWRDLCMPCGNVVAVWGEVRFGSTEGGGCLFGAAGAVWGVVRPVGGVWQCRGQRGWLAGLA